MAAATYQGSVPTRREETGRQLQTRVLHSNQVYPQDKQMMPTRQSIACTKATECPLGSKGERTGKEQELLDLEFIDKMMEYGKFKHILQARLEEMRKIEAFVERDIEDLQRDYEKTKKATKEKLEELIKLRAFVERDIEDLQRDYEKTKKATKEKIEELDELRECAERYEKELMEVIEDDEEKWKDHRGLNKEDHFENDEKLPVDSHKRTLLQRLKDLCSKNLRKKKKSIAEAPTNFVSFEPKDEEKGLAVRACGGSHIRDLVQQDMVRRQDKLRGLKGPSRWSIDRCSTPNMAYGCYADSEQYYSGLSRRSSGVPTSFYSSTSSIQRTTAMFCSLPYEDKVKKEPICIVSQPKAQKKEEGSTVDFQFKVRGQGNLMYQWLKDDNELPGQNSDTLVLKCIELCDFGHYHCLVSSQDGFCGSVRSSPAELDVIPVESRNGMRTKLLQEVDLYTRDEVACLLENSRYGLGGWKQVAAEYGMKESDIEGLANSRERGKDVMEFLRGSKPNLTVYSFCKVLKKPKIGRFDIVKLLEGHFLLEKGITHC